MPNTDCAAQEELAKEFSIEARTMSLTVGDHVRVRTVSYGWTAKERREEKMESAYPGHKTDNVWAHTYALTQSFSSHLHS